jgi:hypothetical protein
MMTEQHLHYTIAAVADDNGKEWLFRGCPGYTAEEKVRGMAEVQRFIIHGFPYEEVTIAMIHFLVDVLRFPTSPRAYDKRDIDNFYNIWFHSVGSAVAFINHLLNPESPNKDVVEFLLDWERKQHIYERLTGEPLPPPTED